MLSLVFPGLAKGTPFCHCLSNTWQRKTGVPSLEDHESLRNVFSKDSKGPVHGVRYGSARRAAGGGLGWLRPRASHPEPPQHFTSCAAGCERPAGASLKSGRCLCPTSQFSRSKRKAKDMNGSGDRPPLISLVTSLCLNFLLRKTMRNYSIG